MVIIAETKFGLLQPMEKHLGNCNSFNEIVSLYKLPDCHSAGFAIYNCQSQRTHFKCCLY